MTNIFKKSLKLIYNKLKNYFEKDITNNNNNSNNNKNNNINDNINQSNIDNNPRQNNNNNNNNINDNINQNNINNNDTDYNNKNINTSYIIEKNQKLLKNEFINDNKKQDISKIYNIQEIENKLKTIWDIIKINEDTQAEHLLKSIPTDQWVTMDEIKKKILLEFNIEYKNDKSLYPYLKTLVDINLIKINNTGKKRSWKKNIIILE
jgi:hypothetical protein